MGQWEQIKENLYKACEKIERLAVIGVKHGICAPIYLEAAKQAILKIESQNDLDAFCESDYLMEMVESSSVCGKVCSYRGGTPVTVSQCNYCPIYAFQERFDFLFESEEEEEVEV